MRLTSEMISLCVMIGVYLIGIVLTTYALISSIKDRHWKASIVSGALLIIYIVFGLGLI